MVTTLNGLEMYWLEKAGYFVRRDAFDRDAEDSDLWSFVRSLGADALGCAESTLSFDLQIGDGAVDENHWHRPCGPAPTLDTATQFSQLSNPPHSVLIVLAKEQDESLLALPGTHASPPAGEQMGPLLLGEGSVPGQVRVRMLPGDLLVMLTTLIIRRDSPTINPFALVHSSFGF